MRFTFVPFGLLIAAATAAQPDFTGKWVLDATNSTFAATPAPDRKTLTITREKKLLRLSEKTMYGSAEQLIETECRTDGQFHPVDGPLAGAVKCKFEAATLVREKELPDGKGKMESRLTLSPDSQTATEIVTITGTPTPATGTLVWKRE